MHRPIRRGVASAVVLLLVGLGILAVASPAGAGLVTVTNGTQFTDTGGNVLHAFGDGVVKVGSYYYWFGENRNANGTFKAVSADTWEFRNNVLTQSSAAELSVANVERPKVVYNSSTATSAASYLYQHSAFADAGGGYVRVVNPGTGDGADIQQYTCGSGSNQQWSRTQV